MRALSVLVLLLAACGSKANGTPPTCGNGVVDPEEDCDGGPNCTSDCLFACVDPANECPAAPACEIATCSADHACQNVGDQTQNGMSCGTGMACLDGMCQSTSCACDDGNACNGVETCTPSLACIAGTPEADGTTCATGKLCIGGACDADRCGDGFTSAPEECDDGNAMAGDGCENDCTFSCVSGDATRDCTPADACAGQGTCNDGTHTCMAGTPLVDGTVCTGGTCKSGMCTAMTCGNSVVDPGEACDHGINNGTMGDGCKANCQFACVTAATDCPAAPACEIASCTAQHTCANVADANQNGMTCGTNMTCMAGTCSGGTTGAVCGNGVLEAGEQCDDGNTTNLDGCDATCKFEELQRMNAMSVAFASDAYCTKDALGAAVVGSTAQGQISSAITTGINTGTIDVVMDMLGFDDPSGATNDPQLALGMLGGTPATGASTYDGSNDLDWWYTTDPTTIDGTRTAKTQMPATIAAKVLNAGPTEISLTVNFAGVPVTMDMFATKVRATLGAATKPTASAGTTPGHLAAEHLDPALTAVASMTGGELCGNTTALSFENVLVPSVLVGSTCNQHYATSNSLLDVYIGGCTAVIIPEVKVTQPDVSRDGATYVFTANAAHTVISCTRNGVASTLAICEMNAGYTSLFKFTTDRVIAR